VLFSLLALPSHERRQKNGAHADVLELSQNDIDEMTATKSARASPRMPTAQTHSVSGSSCGEGRCGQSAMAERRLS